MKYLKSDILLMIEHRIGKKVDYTRISPSMFRYIEIENLVVFDSRDRRDILFRINRVKVYYNLFKLIKTHSIISSIENINLSNSSFLLDLDRDMKIVTMLENLLGTGGGDKTPKEGFFVPKVSGSNISITIRKGKDTVVLSNLFYEIGKAEKTLTINLRGRINTRYRVRGNSESLEIASKIKVYGLIGADLKWGEIKVRFLNLVSNYFTMTKQTFQVSFKSGRLSVQKIQDKNPLDFSLSYGKESGKVEIAFKSEHFVPYSVVKFRGKFEKFNKWLLSSITTSSTFSFDLKRGALNYNVTLNALMGKGGVFRKYIPRLRIVSRFYGNLRKIYFRPLDIYSALGTVKFKGDVLLENFFPSGLVTLINVKIPERSETLDAVVSLKRSKGFIVLDSDKLEIGRLCFNSFSMSISPMSSAISFTLNSKIGEPGSLPGVLFAKGKVNIKPSLSLEAELKTDKVPPSRLLLAYGSKDKFVDRLRLALKEFDMTCGIYLRTNFKHWEIFSDGIELVNRRDPCQSLAFGLLYKDKILRISSVKARYKDNDLTGNFYFDFQARDRIDFNSAFVINNREYRFKGRFIPKLGVVIQGNYSLYFSLFYQAGEIASFDFKFKHLPLPIRDDNVTASGSFLGEIKGADEWYIRAKKASLYNLDILQSKRNVISSSFTLTKSKFVLEKISYKDEFSSVTGNGNIDLSIDYASPLDTKAVGWVFLQNPTTRETYRIHLAKAKEMNFELYFSDSPLERIGNFNITGNISGSVKAEDILSNPRAQIIVALERGKINADPVNLGLEIDYRADVIKFKSVNFKYLTHKIIDGSGEINLKTNRFSFISDYSADYSGSKVDLILLVEAKLKNRIKSVSYKGGIKGVFNQDFAGNIKLTSIKVDRENYDSWGIKFSMTKGVFSFRGGPRDTIWGIVRRDGNFKLELLKPFSIEGKLEGRLADNRINAVFNVKKFDLNVLNFLIKSEVIVFEKGYAKGKINIRGPFNDPDFYGTLDVYNGEARSKFSPRPIRPIKTTLLYAGKYFILNKIVTRVGNKPFVSYGKFYIDHWIPDAFDIYFESPDKTGIRFVYNFGPFVVDGYASGKIHVRGEGVQINVKGNVVANYSKVALSEVKKRSNSTQPTELLKVDVNIKTGKRLVFYWPSFNFPILKAYTDIGDKIHVVYNEGNDTYSVRGEIGIQGGEVFYFDRSFYLREGKISFNENQESFDPFTYVLAEIREQDEKGKPVVIYLEAKNKLSKFSPRFYSDPPKSDVEILSMIGGSIFEKVQKRGLGVSAVVLTSELVSQFGILRPFENAVRDFLGLDLFSIRTQILQNLILEKILGNPTNPLDNTTLSLGKYLGNNLFLEMLIRFKTVGVPGETTGFTGLTSDLELSLEWTTPFFLMQWTFIPKHPESLFLTDNSLTLKWKYSY